MANEEIVFALDQALAYLASPQSFDVEGLENSWSQLKTKLAACSQTVAPGQVTLEKVQCGLWNILGNVGFNLQHKHVGKVNEATKQLFDYLQVAAPPAVPTPLQPPGNVEQILKDAQEKVRPLVEHERQGENIGQDIMEFRMKGMNPQETFDFLLKRHQKLLEIEAGAASTPRCPRCGGLVEFASGKIGFQVVLCVDCRAEFPADTLDQCAQFFQPASQPPPAPRGGE